MKKRFIRHNFNMVEIMLAVIVIALGITGTFVLFPVGVNANKSAVADNSIADIAEYVTSFVRAEVLAACRPPDEDNDETNDDDKDKEDTFKSFKQSVVNKKFHNSGTAYRGAIDDVDDPSGWTELKNGNPISTILEHSSEKGVFLIRQLSGPEDNRSCMERKAQAMAVKTQPPTPASFRASSGWAKKAAKGSKPKARADIRKMPT